MAATFFYAWMDATTKHPAKHLAAHCSVPMVVALRYPVNLVVLAALFAPRFGMMLLRSGLVMRRAGGPACR